MKSVNKRGITVFCKKYNSFLPHIYCRLNPTT
jgi:hypothetical protein